MSRFVLPLLDVHRPVDAWGVGHASHEIERTGHLLAVNGRKRTGNARFLLRDLDLVYRPGHVVGGEGAEGGPKWKFKPFRQYSDGLSRLSRKRNVPVTRLESEGYARFLYELHARVLHDHPNSQVQGDEYLTLHPNPYREVARRVYQNVFAYLPLHEILDALTVARSLEMFRTAQALNAHHVVMGKTHVEDWLGLKLIDPSRAHFVNASPAAQQHFDERLAHYQRWGHVLNAYREEADGIAQNANGARYKSGSGNRAS